MEILSQVNWFAIQAKPHRDELAAAGLRKLDLEICAPRVKVEQQVCGVWRWVTKALFPGYFFSRFCPAVSLETIRFTSGVLRVVGGSAIPTPIESAIIEDIQESVGDCGVISRSHSTLAPGAEVSIQAGPFMGLAGIVLRESNDGKRVTILLKLLENARLVTERRCLQLASS
jgi:Transcription antiterminator